MTTLGRMARLRPAILAATTALGLLLGAGLATATSLNNLGSLLQDQGDPAGSRPYLEQALAILQRVLGPDHPMTQTVRGNLDTCGTAEKQSG